MFSKVYGIAYLEPGFTALQSFPPFAQQVFP